MNMLIVQAAIAFWFLALAGGFYWTRRYVRALEAQTPDRERIEALEARLAALEAAHGEARDVLERPRPMGELPTQTPDPDAPHAHIGP
jgi:hypothetical protein